MHHIARMKPHQPSDLDENMRAAGEREAKHSFLAVEGTRLHWAEIGTSTDRTPVVMLHGLSDSHRTWRQIAPRLGSDRHVLMPDLPGFGLSERPDASYRLDWHAHMMDRWLDALGLEEVDFVGHSFGGGVAQWMLLACPRRIRRLVLVAPGGLGREVSLPLRLASLPKVVEWLGQGFMSIGTRMALGSAGERPAAEDLAALMEMNGMRGTARAFARTVRDVISWRGQRRTFFQRAHELLALPPIAVCWGDRDRIIPSGHGEAFARSVDGVVLTRFPRCGHYLHRERPELFAYTVRRFLDDPAVRRARLRRERSSTRSIPLPAEEPAREINPGIADDLDLHRIEGDRSLGQRPFSPFWVEKAVSPAHIEARRASSVRERTPSFE